MHIIRRDSDTCLDDQGRNRPAIGQQSSPFAGAQFAHLWRHRLSWVCPQLFDELSSSTKEGN